jgi:hypothetical protein
MPPALPSRHAERRDDDAIHDRRTPNLLGRQSLFGLTAKRKPRHILRTKHPLLAPIILANAVPGLKEP